MSTSRGYRDFCSNSITDDLLIITEKSGTRPLTQRRARSECRRCFSAHIATTTWEKEPLFPIMNLDSADRHETLERAPSAFNLESACAGSKPRKSRSPHNQGDRASRPLLWSRQSGVALQRPKHSGLRGPKSIVAQVLFAVPGAIFKRPVYPPFRNALLMAGLKFQFRGTFIQMLVRSKKKKKRYLCHELFIKTSSVTTVS